LVNDSEYSKSTGAKPIFKSLLAVFISFSGGTKSLAVGPRTAGSSQGTQSLAVRPKTAGSSASTFLKKEKKKKETKKKKKEKKKGKR
jgi:hypothetical protein